MKFEFLVDSSVCRFCLFVINLIKMFFHMNLFFDSGICLFLCLFIPSSILCENKLKVDENGYVAYCPCMGRFGNQADHFLGALGFAKGLNRTLVLSPWVEYRYGEPKSIQVPFDTYFKVEPLMKFHRVITMDRFMSDIAPAVWPPDKRIAFCYMERGKTGGCNAKEGNPFGPFWNTFNIDFVGSEIYGPLHYDVHHTDVAAKWKNKYPPSEWPVLAFAGAPGSFPVQKENKGLHRHLKWSDKVDNEAQMYIKNKLPKGAFIGIHLRNGLDWVRACEHISPGSLLFSAAQCLGYLSEKGQASHEMCFPSTHTIIKQLKRIMRRVNDPIVAIAVASDSNHLIIELTDAFKQTKISIHKIEGSTPHVDLAILGRANHFIGNCISSFTAFVKRERDARGFASEFWAFPPTKKSGLHDEL